MEILRVGPAGGLSDFGQKIRLGLQAHLREKVRVGELSYTHSLSFTLVPTRTLSLTGTKSRARALVSLIRRMEWQAH